MAERKKFIGEGRVLEGDDCVIVTTDKVKNSEVTEAVRLQLIKWVSKMETSSRLKELVRQLKILWPSGTHGDPSGNNGSSRWNI